MGKKAEASIPPLVFQTMHSLFFFLFRLSLLLTSGDTAYAFDVCVKRRKYSL